MNEFEKMYETKKMTAEQALSLIICFLLRRQGNRLRLCQSCSI